MCYRPVTFQIHVALETDFSIELVHRRRRNGSVILSLSSVAG